MRRTSPFLLSLGLAATLAASTSWQSIGLYREFRSAWSWDLAYYNQWFRALTIGDGIISVRPIGPFVQEGPSIWTMNYLAPVRLALAPIYRIYPDPKTLLVIQSVVLWMVIPAAYGLVRAESKSGSSWIALSAAALVPLTPLIRPLAWNDFRELQLALPFGLWAVHGVRSRSKGLSALGVGGLLACRQEFAFVVASLALLPPRMPEDIGRRSRWSLAFWSIGLAWVLFGFLGYERWVVNSNAWETFFKEITGPRVPWKTILRTATEFLAVGLGGWAILACLYPRAGLLVLPWVWNLSSGRLLLGCLGTEQWDRIRYTAPMVTTALAMGCLGYASLGNRLAGRRGGTVLLAGVWLTVAASCISDGRTLEAWLARVPRPMGAAEAAEVWSWIDRVGPDDGVLAHYKMSAPLSSRRLLYSYVMSQNAPKGYPHLGSEIGWAFICKGDIAPDLFAEQGFRLVHGGPRIEIYRRDGPAGPHPILSRKAPTAQGRSEMEWIYYLGLAIMFLIEAAGTAVLLVPGLAVVFLARRRLARAVAIGTAESGVAGREIAERTLDVAEVSGVSIETTEASPTNYFDPSVRSIRLSRGVAEGRTVYSASVAARQAAHAVRWAEGDPLRLLRNVLFFATRLGTAAGWLTMGAGVALWSWAPIHLGAALFSAALLGPLPLLLFMEQDASRRAALSLRANGLAPETDAVLAALDWAVVADAPVWRSLRVGPRPISAS
jgi:Zn-dependent membrane protease YugP